LPTLTSNGLINWKTKQISDPRLEQVVGSDNFQNPWFLEKGVRLSKTVGLIPNFGTAFLISPDLLMTNWHVFRRSEWAKGKSVLFNVEQNEDGLPLPVESVKLDPDNFFYSNEDLDVAVVRTENSPGLRFGFIDIKNSIEPTTETRVNIIQHPGAGFKKIAVRDNGLKFFDDKILQYWTDTEHGSSGSPLFDDRWQIIGLHNLQDSALGAGGNKIYYNQGYRINKIFHKLIMDNPGLI
jgi:V8-like Glu-specific endopeptidase